MKNSRSTGCSFIQWNGYFCFCLVGGLLTGIWLKRVSRYNSFSFVFWFRPLLKYAPTQPRLASKCTLTKTQKRGFSQSTLRNRLTRCLSRSKRVSQPLTPTAQNKRINDKQAAFIIDSFVLCSGVTQGLSHSKRVPMGLMLTSKSTLLQTQKRGLKQSRLRNRINQPSSHSLIRSPLLKEVGVLSKVFDGFLGQLITLFFSLFCIQVE